MKNPRITQEEIEIIKKAQAGDKSAFSKLYYRYKPFVENILYRYIKDKDEARDIANIVFLTVHRKLSMFTAYDSFGGWLRIITNHTAIDYLRTKHESQDIEEERLSLDMPGSTEDDLVNHLTSKQLIAEFNKLPEVTRKIFKLFYEEDMKVDEISDALRIPVGTIKSTLSRTRRRIKKRLI